MGSNARESLLDAAERLFAEDGIAHVSDRRVAEAAGNTNHSAVRYYFGGREGLLRALLDRQLDSVEPERARLLAASDSLLGDIQALILPVTDDLAALPTPSWRARFLNQVQHDPVAAALLRASGDRAPAATRIVRSIIERMQHLDRAIAEGRASLMLHVVTTACAQIEERAHRSGEPAQWPGAGHFLCDAIAGMLQAPVTPFPPGAPAPSGSGDESGATA
ncbi:TetR/AcrR family transcriptional regulator [Nocardioides sp. zg-536]|uniref:TetR/AcrR family transcriptional regulator n=1 Tax=Nocardioides faecalis TaxID=2803858 RepID=A0A939BXL9_9ACTN|nr:TetR/AcrR family transcriptional regulator [Nocardioides faecalis]MBM9459463.1 TetR/AcrR family transcriptional regulator [Nocardioides faecalis]QVI59434.1 TetR/AcrR family transcriptional regulator [Nocardioides faecalis]